MKTNQVPTLYQGFGLQSGKPQDPSKSQGVIGFSFPREKSSRGFISNKSQPKLGYDMDGYLAYTESPSETTRDRDKKYPSYYR